MSIKKLINTASWERGISYSMDGGYFTEGVTTDKRTVIVKHDHLRQRTRSLDRRMQH